MRKRASGDQQEWEQVSHSLVQAFGIVHPNRMNVRPPNAGAKAQIHALGVTDAAHSYGPWWNSGQSHMNAAFPQTYFARMGLISLLQTIHVRA